MGVGAGGWVLFFSSYERGKVLKTKRAYLVGRSPVKCLVVRETD